EGMARVRFRVLDDEARRMQSAVRISGAEVEPLEFLSRDERFDSNDHAEAMLPIGATVSAEFGDGSNAMEFTVARDEQLVTMKMPRRDESEPLTREQAQEESKRLRSEHEERIRRTRRAEHDARVLKIDGHEMPFWYTTYGDAPEGERSLYISMHGGGGAPAEVNDQQWDNQKKLYTPEEGVYLAPRAPTNTWNLWHQGHIDAFYDRLIENMIVFEGVDPNRVYLMGYSAGGDGVYQLAPRMADRFAAAAMMAGHPNETKADGLRNLPFTLHMGGEDAAYDRNNIARQWKKRLADLHGMDPGGYTHHVEIHEGKGHWMEREDAVAVPWMAEHDRNLRPQVLVWLQDDVVHDRFYWLAVDEPVARRKVVVVLDGQTIRIHTAGGAGRLKFRLDDTMLDLDRDVVVEMAGKELFRGQVPRTVETMRRTLAERGDPDGIFTAELVVDLSEEDAFDVFVPEAVDIDVDGEPRTYRYRLRRPGGDAAAPLVVFLHGMGERGDDNLAQLGHFPHRVIREDHFKDKRCFVLAPQCPGDDTWARWNDPDNPDPTHAMKAAIAAIDKVMAEDRVDPDRVYLVGLSMGGYGTWDLAARQPERFAGIVPVCGGGDPAKMDRLVDVPIWAFHGTADRVVPEDRTVRLIEALREAGGEPRYSALPGIGHNSWDTAFGPAHEGGAMDWLFQQRRTP
ncbi:MAG: alpha/beta fold hydrolase, partial [Phycisphaerales bacterium]|nr:alpha/beta fold hydrolase [Phycisphaerales bacterium]